MKNTRSALGVCAFLSGCLLAISWSSGIAHGYAFHPKVIYGDDDRLDLYQVSDAELLRLAGSTVALIRKHKITINEDSQTATLLTSEFGTEMSLCKDEPFYEQPTSAFCSGSLVGPDLILTAGHCIDDLSDCKNTSFVFGFAIRQEGVMPTNVPATEVYGCSSIVGRKYEGRGADWALIKLDRTVENHTPLALNRTGVIEKDTSLVVIGHPSGLPTKVAGGAMVRDPSPQGFFVANLDTYGGNSGSAVFNAKTGLIEGVLVRGESDFRNRPGAFCRESFRCANDACRGEDVTKIADVLELVP